MKIKALTLNIWGGKLLERAADFIYKENPDIVFLQEVYDGTGDLDSKYRSLSIFQEKLRYSYCSFEPSFIDRGPSGDIPQGNAVLSRFPAGNQRTIFFDIPFGKFSLEKADSQSGINQFIPMSMLNTNIKINNKDVNTYSVHGIWGFDGEDSERRLAMSKTIVDEVKDKENVILAGDFNLNPHTKTIKNIENYLQNVFKNELASTFNMKHKKLAGYATAAVDMIFVSKSIKIINHYMPDVDVSDHMPLVCELEI